MKKKKCTTAVISTDDQPERRISFDRRQFAYADIYPERRSGIDRRGTLAATHRRGKLAEPSNKAKWECCH